MSAASDAVNERVFVQWQDTDTQDHCALGSTSTTNKTAVQLFLRIRLTEQHIIARFALSVALTRGGRSQSHPFLLLLPLHASPNTAEKPSVRFEIVDVSAITTPVISSAISEARLSASSRVLRASFRLTSPGFIVRPDTNTKVKPHNSTSQDLLLGLRSLSQAQAFTVHMKSSDYAHEGFKLMEKLLLSGPQKPSLDLACMFGGKGAVLMDWDKSYVGSDAASPPPPPAYATTGPSTVQVRRTSSAPPPRAVSDGSDMPEAVVETDCEGQSSDGEDAKSLRTRLECAANGLVPGRKRGRSSSTEPLPQAPISPLRSSVVHNDVKTMERDMLGWCHDVMQINEHVFLHSRVGPRLGEMGQNVREGDAVQFRTTRALCTALFVFDPFDTADDDLMSSPVVRELLHDVELLARWTLIMHSLGDLTFMQEFMVLGMEARRIGDGAKQDREAFKLLRSGLVTKVCVKYGVRSET